jgi:hypothetical protein
MAFMSHTLSQSLICLTYSQKHFEERNRSTPAHRHYHRFPFPKIRCHVLRTRFRATSQILSSILYPLDALPLPSSCQSGNTGVCSPTPASAETFLSPRWDINKYSSVGVVINKASLISMFHVQHIKIPTLKRKHPIDKLYRVNK